MPAESLLSVKPEVYYAVCAHLTAPAPRLLSCPRCTFKRLLPPQHRCIHNARIGGFLHGSCSMTQTGDGAFIRRAAEGADAALQLPAIAGILKQDMPQAHRCMMLSVQSVAIAFITHPQLSSDALPAFALSERARACTAMDTFHLSLKFMRKLYDDARIIDDTNWFALQTKHENSAGVCVERLAESLLLNQLQQARSCLNDPRVQQLYCAMFQTLNALQTTQCPLLHPNRRLLILCQQCAAGVTVFMDAIASTPSSSTSKTIQALKGVISGLLGVLCTCSPSEVLCAASKVLRVAPPAVDASTQHPKQACFPSISAAIAAASPGCVILVAPGTYSETLSLRVKGVVITSDCVHAGCTRCSCIKIISASSPAVRVLAPSCRLQNLHVSSNSQDSTSHESICLGGGPLIVSHCTLCSVASAATGCLSFVDCEFENSCRNCIVLTSGAAAIAVDCVLNCSLGYAAVASDSSITLIRCSLLGVSSVSQCLLRVSLL